MTGFVLTEVESYAQKIGVSLTPEALDKLALYASLLMKWNGVVHLTSVNSWDGVLVSHLMDSLSVVPYLSGMTRLADVGSGAGLPGIPLAIAMPSLSVTLLECNQKKCFFLSEVVRQCELRNVSVINKRVELYIPEIPFSAVITRAFSSLKQMLQQTAHLCDNGGSFLAMKASVSDKEMQEIPTGFVLDKQIMLKVPTFSNRTLWVLKRTNPGEESAQ